MYSFVHVLFPCYKIVLVLVAGGRAAMISHAISQSLDGLSATIVINE